MACHLHDLVLTEPIEEPVGDTGAAKIVEYTLINARPSHDHQELTPEIAHRAVCLLRTPAAQLSALLDPVITLRRDKDVWVPFRLLSLMLRQESDHIVGEWQGPSLRDTSNYTQ